jgi:hypothetical protein
MIDEKSLRSQRRKLALECKSILDQEHITVADKEKFDRLMNAADEIANQLDQLRGKFSESSFVN